MNKKKENTVYKKYFQTDKGHFCAIISYLGFFWLIGLFLHPENKDPKVRFHIGQGMILFIFTVIGQLLLLYLSFLFNEMQIVQADFIILFLKVTYFVGICLLMIKGALNAQKKEEKRIPVIGKLSFYS